MGSLANATTDALLDEFIRNNAGTAAHPVGTASMSSRNASYGVVDPDLKVKGVGGLRIVDASVLVRLTIFLLSFSQTLDSLLFQVGILRRRCTLLLKEPLI